MTIPPVQAEYTPKGETIVDGDLPIYVSGACVLGGAGGEASGPVVCRSESDCHRRCHLTAKPGATKGIIYVPDIFGVSSQAHQVMTQRPNTQTAGASPSSQRPQNSLRVPTHALHAIRQDALPNPDPHPQVVDLLADAGFAVAFPDVFRGEPWPMAKFPPPDRKELVDWAMDRGGKVRCGWVLAM